MQLVIGIALARLLLPEQFGLIGMISVFMAVSQSLLDAGFGAALIQKQDATETDRCSIFYFNIAVGIGIAALLCGAAPRIAAFYNQPPLTSLTRAMSLVIVINFPWPHSEYDFDQGVEFPRDGPDEFGGKLVVRRRRRVPGGDGVLGSGVWSFSRSRRRFSGRSSCGSSIRGVRRSLSVSNRYA